MDGQGDSPGDPAIATSLLNGLRLLEAFPADASGAGNAELAARCGLSRPSVSRLTTTLATLGLVAFDPATRRYRLGAAALTMAYPMLVNLGVRRRARLEMKRLSDALGATISLGIADRHRMVYVETLPGNEPVAFRPDVGARLPMLQSAMGRAWLVSATAADRSRTLDAIRTDDPAHHARWSRSLVAARRELRSLGFTSSRGDWQDDIHAVAVPLGLAPNGDRLVLNAGVAARRLRPGELQGRIGPALLALGRRIEAAADREPGVARHFAEAGWSSAPAAQGNASDHHQARTLARGIALLLSFEPTERDVGNRELARRLGLGPPTVVRLTRTLAATGYLKRDPMTARYRLGPASLSLAYPMLSGLQIRRIARPVMLALSERLGGAVSLGLQHGIGMIYVETAWHTDGRLLPPDIGAPMPMLATAMGRAWLAGASGPERAQLLNRIGVADPTAYGRLLARAAAAVSAFHRDGYCTSRDFRPDVEAFAVPLRRPVGGIRFVLNCGVLAPRPLSERRAARIGAALVDAVAAIEQALAQAGPSAP